MFSPPTHNPAGGGGGASFSPADISPAISLTRDLPQGVDGDILFLPGADLRNFLFTFYSEKGLPARQRLDFTAVYHPDQVVNLARNILVLSLILDGEVETEVVWGVYYHLWLSREEREVVRTQVDRLLQRAGWCDDRWGEVVKFVDEKTLEEVRGVWEGLGSRLREGDPDEEDRDRERFEEVLKKSRARKEAAYGRKGQAVVVSSARSCAPMAMQIMGDLVELTEESWERGVTGPGETKEMVPNPVMAAALLSEEGEEEEEVMLEYPIDPLIGFHLAAGGAKLTQLSPLRLEDQAGEGNYQALASLRIGEPSQDEGKDIKRRLVETAKLQFKLWTEAFREAARAGRTVIRFVAADFFAVCTTLKQNLDTGALCADCYRQGGLGFETLHLADSEYSREYGKAPRQFDVIDTGILSDQFAMLSVLVSALPVLKSLPSSTIYTDCYANSISGSIFQGLLAKDTATWTTLLGLIPTEYWTNATAISVVDEVLALWTNRSSAENSEHPEKKLQSRLAWKRSKHLAGLQQKPFVHEGHLMSILLGLFREMSGHDFQKAVSDGGTTTTPKYPRGTVTSLMKALFEHIQVKDLYILNLRLHTEIRQHSASYVDYSAHITNELSRLWFASKIKSSRGYPEALREGGTDFSKWPETPLALAVTVVVPQTIWKPLADFAREHGIPLAIAAHIGYIDAPEDAESKDNFAEGRGPSTYPDTQISFGAVRAHGSPDQEDYRVIVQEDNKGWKGDSTMVVSFFAPPSHVQDLFCKENWAVSLRLADEVYNEIAFRKLLGPECTLLKTTVKNPDYPVFVTASRPGQISPYGHEMMNASAPSLDEEGNTRMTLFVDGDNGYATKVTGATGHADITFAQGLKLLANKVPIEMQQSSPFTIDLVFGKNELVMPMTFPFPVSRSTCKPRIARTSHYVEVVAPFADPVDAPILDNYIFPTTLYESSRIPATLNLPHLSLDELPILATDDKRRARFLTTLTSLEFSARERRLRQQVTESEEDNVLSSSPRLNFKESIFTIFMLASGLQGGQTGLFAISDPEHGGIHMLLFVSAIRLDGAHASVVLDAAILPFTKSLVDSGELEAFLLLLRTLECCTITVDDTELVLWKKCLPALVERCRSWNHDPATCEYVMKGEIPLSNEPGKQVICSCGQGKLPDNFIPLPEWDTAAKYATRVAISPVYASRLVEEIIDPELAKTLGEQEVAEKPVEETTCRSCGKSEKKDGVQLKKCMRCLAVRYCSPACQKKDWKKHRMECEEAKEYHLNK
ncbi:hypothetical protein QBC35DRAFT_474963 [Podospora australis]|uniref:MYND-type domain-containing protein n=1 Tax=Podospora australis TaxID=1536484 RepID=A0AAN6WRP7_9PEZI|nr:hypothetical protein QBC35DRAFT_474963 [Podospora australis]